MTTQTKSHDRLTAEERRELPNTAFGIPETREYPLVDAEHIKLAITYFRYAPDNAKSSLARRIMRRAAQMGVEIHSPTIQHWAEQE